MHYSTGRLQEKWTGILVTVWVRNLCILHRSQSFLPLVQRQSKHQKSLLNPRCCGAKARIDAATAAAGLSLARWQRQRAASQPQLYYYQLSPSAAGCFSTPRLGYYFLKLRLDCHAEIYMYRYIPYIVRETNL